MSVGLAHATHRYRPMMAACSEASRRLRDKLKADAQKVVSIISGDKAKAQAYCQINRLAEQIGEAEEDKDSKKAEALSRQIFDLEVKLGPNYITLANSLKEIDPNSPQAQEINSILAPLDDSCED